VLRVLVVHRGASALARQLGLRGFDVVDVGVVADALRMVDEIRPHAIVADVDAGEGLALCGAVRTSFAEYGRTLPIVAIAHAADPSTRLRPSADGFWAVLPASCSAGALAATVGRAIVAVASATRGAAARHIVRTLGFVRAHARRPPRAIAWRATPRRDPDDDD
jgi:CheY-like chemotaxis protein